MKRWQRFLSWGGMGLGAGLVFLGLLFLFPVYSAAGLSNGAPYCLNCVMVGASFMQPEQYDFILYTEGNRTLSHRVVFQNQNIFVVVALNSVGEENLELVPRENFIATRLFIVGYKTRDINEACSYLGARDLNYFTDCLENRGFFMLNLPDGNNLTFFREK